MKPFPACVPGGYRQIACQIEVLRSAARATVSDQWNRFLHVGYRQVPCTSKSLLIASYPVHSILVIFFDVIHAAPGVDFKHILTHHSVFISKIYIILQSKNALTTVTIFVFSGNVGNRCQGHLDNKRDFFTKIKNVFKGKIALMTILFSCFFPILLSVVKGKYN